MSEQSEQSDPDIMVCEGIESKRADKGDPAFPWFVDCYKGDRKLDGRAAHRTEADARRHIKIWEDDPLLKILYGALRYEVIDGRDTFEEVLPDYMIDAGHTQPYATCKVCNASDSDPVPEAKPVAQKKVFYLAHPVSGDHVGNAMRAVQWIRWFAENVPHLIVVAPWVAEVLAFPTKMPDGAVGSWEWALANDETIVAKLDGVIAVGGKISRGMQREVDATMRAGGTFVDMSRYATPSDLPEDFYLDEDI